jgi:hypothetical protein
MANLKHSVALFIAHFNFCRKHSAVAQTPAQACGLADHQWTIEELLTAIGLFNTPIGQYQKPVFNRSFSPNTSVNRGVDEQNIG